MRVSASTEKVKVTISNSGVVTITTKSKQVVVTIGEDGKVTTETKEPPYLSLRLSIKQGRSSRLRSCLTGVWRNSVDAHVSRLTARAGSIPAIPINSETVYSKQPRISTSQILRITGIENESLTTNSKDQERNKGATKWKHCLSWRD